MTTISNKKEALDFLRSQQPMPFCEDLALDSEYVGNLLDSWGAALDFLIENPCEEAIPLVLNSFGGGDGFEAYQTAGDFLSEFPIEVVLPYLTRALLSPNELGKGMVADLSFDQLVRIDQKEVSPSFWDEILLFVDACVKTLVETSLNGDPDPFTMRKVCLLWNIRRLDEKGFLNWEQYGATIKECHSRDAGDKRLTKYYDEIFARHQG